MQKHIYTLFLIALTLFSVVGLSTAAQVRNIGDRIYLIDRFGYHLDITQAVERGFKPHKFNHGIGVNTIQPLDDSNFGGIKPPRSSPKRIIGLALGRHAHAYEVRYLRHHEIANTTIAGQPVAAAY